MGEPKLFAGPASDDLIAALVTDGGEEARAFGRLLATGIPGLFKDWLNEEARRGTDVFLLMMLPLTIAGNVTASVALQKFRTSGDAMIAERAGRYVSELVAKHLTSLRAREAGNG